MNISQRQVCNTVKGWMNENRQTVHNTKKLGIRLDPSEIYKEREISP